MQGILKKKNIVISVKVFDGRSLTLSMLMRIKCSARQIAPVSAVTHFESVLVGDGILLSLYHERFAYRIRKSAA